MKKVSLDVLIQLIGMLGILGVLIPAPGTISYTSLFKLL